MNALMTATVTPITNTSSAGFRTPPVAPTGGSTRVAHAAGPDDLMFFVLPVPQEAEIPDFILWFLDRGWARVGVGDNTVIWMLTTDLPHHHVFE